MPKETLDHSDKRRRPRSGGPPLPGLLLIFSTQGPMLSALPMVSGALELGRAELEQLGVDDPTVSRRHVRVVIEDGLWSVRDLGSRNGTLVDGRLLQKEWRGAAPAALRIGDSVFLAVADVKAWKGGVTADGDTVRGPGLASSWETILQTAQRGQHLHISGESGTGKELAARAYHAAGPHPEGPFVAVNCAAIPEGVAERLFFGARRGAYSGAENAEGYLGSAHGGTLFLDEVAELDLTVQAKLLRVLESKELLALGAARPRSIDVRLCSATHKDLRAEVTAGRFREDLYFRLARPDVRLPPLRERREEIPWLITQALKRHPLRPRAEATLVEACLLRWWPGNVRELLVEIAAAAEAAARRSSATAGAEDLALSAGKPFEAPVEPVEQKAEAAPRRSGAPTEEEVITAWREAKGNISDAARKLGVHRTQMRRWVARYGLRSIPASDE